MKIRRSLPILLAASALAFVVAPLASPAPVAHGQEADSEGPERFNGSWRFAGSASSGRRTIEAAVERAIDGMNFITQPIARGRLRDKNPLVRRIDINLAPPNCRVVFDGSRTYRGQLGAWTPHTFDGDTIRVQFRHRADSIVQLFRTDSGTRRNVYRLLPNNRMRLEVTVQADSLPHDMTYRLTYRQ